MRNGPQRALSERGRVRLQRWNETVGGRRLDNPHDVPIVIFAMYVCNWRVVRTLCKGPM